MDDPRMDDLRMEDPEIQDPETENPVTEDPGAEDPEAEDDPGITLDEIVRRFGALYALTAEEAEQERELCAAALGRVEEERNLLPGGGSPLMDYAAALAGHRFVLRCLARGITVAIGDPRSGPAGARCAAKEMEEDYRAAASRWLRPKGLCFRRTAGTAAEAGRCRWTR